MDLLITRPSSEWLFFSWSHSFLPIILLLCQAACIAASSHKFTPNHYRSHINMVKLHTSVLAITLAMGSALADSRPHPLTRPYTPPGILNPFVTREGLFAR